MNTSLLHLLKNQIDITQVPFSDRGSRILVYRSEDESHLYIKLAERLTELYPGIESYLNRPPFIEDLRLIDGNGNPLNFELTTSAEMLQFHTSIGDFYLVFQDEKTLSFGLPSHTSCGFCFLMQADGHESNGNGGRLKSVRDLTYSTDAPIGKATISSDAKGYITELIVNTEEDTAVMFHIAQSGDSPCHILPFSTAKENALNRWENWFASAPDVDETYREKYAYAWWVMANNMISPKGYIKYEAIMPTKAFYVGVWLWDCAMHAIALRHAHPELARDQLRVMLMHQLDDGMLPDAIYDEGVVSEIDHPIPGKVTKPPIFAWAALKIQEMSPDPNFLREIYPALVRCNDWWLSSNNGLAHYVHPYSSGLDNSPLWDHGLPVESPDINTYLILQMDSLANITEQMDDNQATLIWRKRARDLAQQLLTKLWDEETGIFVARQNQKPIPVLTPFNLYPLWTAHMPQEVIKRLIVHLLDEREFAGRYMIPTVARKDPAYNQEMMWRGPVWANINYFFIEALQKAGEIDLARELRAKTLAMIMSQPGIHEYYNPETGVPPASAAPMFGWTAAVFIDLALQASKES